MKSLLKTGSIQCKALARKIKIQELSAAGNIALLEAKRGGQSNLEIAAIGCKYGVLEFRKETHQDILENVPIAALVELSEAVLDLTGLEDEPAKNSEGAPSDDSCSDSVSH